MVLQILGKEWLFNKIFEKYKNQIVEKCVFARFSEDAQL